MGDWRPELEMRTGDDGVVYRDLGLRIKLTAENRADYHLQSL